ncbi:unnamed protein product, partial [marine sediment metagenome]
MPNGVNNYVDVLEEEDISQLISIILISLGKL